MQTTKIMCQLCDSREGEMLCENCKRAFIFCAECFKFSHQSDTLGAHKTRAISSEGIENLIKNGYLCKDHPEERYSLMCKTCSAAICSECAIRGKHRTHKVLPAAEYVKNYISAQSRKLESVDLPYEDIARCVAAVEEVYGKRKSFVKKAADVIDQLFKGIFQDIAKNRQLMNLKFDEFEAHCLKKREDLLIYVNNLMSRDNPTMKTNEELKDELGALVKVWREKYAELQNEIAQLETMAFNANMMDITNKQKEIDFSEIKVRYTLVRGKCMSFKQQIDKKFPGSCLLAQVCQRLLDNHSNIESGTLGPIWNTASSRAISDCLSWHCYVITKKLPIAFTVKLRLNSISSAAGDWTHAVGITDDVSLKQRIRPTDYAVLFNTTHWAFTPNFESAKHDFKNNDIITITLDRNKEMKVQINNEIETVAFTDVKGDYYLFCSLYGKVQEVEILGINE